MAHDNGNQMISIRCINDRRCAMLRRVEESYITPSTETEKRASDKSAGFSSLPDWLKKGAIFFRPLQSHTGKPGALSRNFNKENFSRSSCGTLKILSSKETRRR